MSLPDVPVGDAVTWLVAWLTDNLSGLFDVIGTVLGFLVEHLDAGLVSIPAIALSVVLAAVAWWLRSLPFAAFTLIGFLLIESMGQWEESMSTLSLVLVASAIAAVIAVPLGIASARSEIVSTLLRPLLDLMQTMPVFVYLIPAIFFFGIGVVPGVVATVVFAMPPGIRLTELGIRQVDKEIVEAGEAFGASPRKILTGIQLPLALPTVMAGINQVIMLSLSMVVIAGMVGAGGLGAVVYTGITRLDVGLGFEGGLAVVILAIFLDRITGALGVHRRRWPVAKRLRRREPAAQAA